MTKQEAGQKANEIAQAAIDGKISPKQAFMLLGQVRLQTGG